MAVVDLSDLFELGADVLGTTINAKGTLLCQTGDVLSGQVTGDGTEWWQHVGFASLPALAKPGVAACQALVTNSGSNDVAFGSRDLRGQAIYGNLGPGETTVYAGGANGTGQAKVLLKGDGAIILYTTEDNTAAGAGIYLRLDKEKLAFFAPWGRLVFDATGFHVETQNGGKIDLANVNYPLPPPINTLAGSSCRITASTVALDSPIVLLGPSIASGVPGGGTFFPVTSSLIPLAPLPVQPFVIAPVTGAPGGPTPIPTLVPSGRVFVAQ